jgi:CRISPR/Cas system-associated endoribonuclease Cas2
MAVLLITYDLNSPGQKHAKLLEKVKQYNWARLSESSYAIETDESPQQVFDSLRPITDQNDNLYVINLKRPYAGFGPQDVNDWLESKLPY